MADALSASADDRVAKLALESLGNQAEIVALSPSFDDSTGLSWLWAFLFGPIYYAVHGFCGRALLVFALNFVFLIGFVVSPFLAYPAWRARAQTKAANMIAIDKFRTRG